MSKKRYRFYGGMLSAQEKWLNKMAAKGQRLIRTKKLLYEFEACHPGQYQYRIEFVGHKSKTNAADYRAFLEEMGYKVFDKNINLNYSVGKARFRPWADQGGRVATNATTFNRELLIVEKENDNTPFELHTSFEDRANYYGSLRNPWLFLFLLCGLFGIIYRSPVFGAFSLLALIPALLYQLQVVKARRRAKTEEW